MGLCVNCGIDTKDEKFCWKCGGRTTDSPTVEEPKIISTTSENSDGRKLRPKSVNDIRNKNPSVNVSKEPFYKVIYKIVITLSIVFCLDIIYLMLYYILFDTVQTNGNVKNIVGATAGRLIYGYFPIVIDNPVFNFLTFFIAILTCVFQIFIFNRQIPQYVEKQTYSFMFLLEPTIHLFILIFLTFLPSILFQNTNLSFSTNSVEGIIKMEYAFTNLIIWGILIGSIYVYDRFSKYSKSVSLNNQLHIS